jgi:hypothetical protein
MPSVQMVGRIPVNREIVSRSKACRILAAKQELKPKGKESKSQVGAQLSSRQLVYTHTCQ